MSEKDQDADEVTYYVFVRDGRRHLAPERVSAGATTVTDIFSVPKPGAIGTLDELNNGIALLKFGEYGKEPECTIAAQNYGKRSIAEDFAYIPSQNHTDDTIVYSALDYIVIANIKTGKTLCAQRKDSTVKIENGEARYANDADLSVLHDDIKMEVEQYCINPETGERIPEGEECLTLATFINGARVFTLADLGYDDDDVYKPERSYEISGVSFLNPRDNLFVVINQLDILKEDSDHESGWGWDVGIFLQVVKLEDGFLTNTGWITQIDEENSSYTSDAAIYHSWFVHDQKLIAYDRAKHRMLCTDGYAAAAHPFAEIFNANSYRIGKVNCIALHPKLPFGIIIEEDTQEKQTLTLLRWDITGRKKQNRRIVSYGRELQPLAELFELTSLTYAYQSFSPDGKWYVVGCVKSKTNGSDSPNFIAVPIIPADKKHPFSFDINNLTVLGPVTSYSTHMAWTSEPTSYVVSDGELLHKWHLGELANARVFEIPSDDDERKKSSVFRRIARWFGLWK